MNALMMLWSGVQEEEYKCMPDHTAGEPYQLCSMHVVCDPQKRITFADAKQLQQGFEFHTFSFQMCF